MAEDVTDEALPKKAEPDVRDLRDGSRCARRAVLEDEEIARSPQREEVDRRPGHDLVGVHVNRHEGVEECESCSGRRGGEEPELPAAQLVGSEHAEERACEHHSLEADVGDAATLGEHPADGGVRQRRRPDERRGQERRPDDDLFKVRLARTGREKPETDAEDRGDHCGPADAPHSPRDRPSPRGDRRDAGGDRPPRVTGVNGREIDPEGHPARFRRVRRGEAPAARSSRFPGRSTEPAQR